MPGSSSAVAGRPPSAARTAGRELARVLRAAFGPHSRTGAPIWVSTEAWMHLGGRPVRADVAVILGEPPLDGVLGRPPAVVLDLVAGAALPAPGPGAPLRSAPRDRDALRRSARRWLAAGSAEVWNVDDEGVVVHRRGVPGLVQDPVRIPPHGTVAAAALAPVSAGLLTGSVGSSDP